MPVRIAISLPAVPAVVWIVPSGNLKPLELDSIKPATFSLEVPGSVVPMPAPLEIEDFLMGPTLPADFVYIIPILWNPYYCHPRPWGCINRSRSSSAIVPSIPF